MTRKYQNALLGFVTAAIAFVLAGFALNSASTSAPKAAAKAGEIGSQLPEFSVRDFHGRELSSASLHGKVESSARSPAETAAPKAVTKAGEIGSQLPEFSVRDFHGHEISSASLHGKVEFSPQSPAETAAPKAVTKAGEIGSQLPEFSVRDFHRRELSSASLHGKVVIVDFWATWCQPCKKEMPGYQRLLDRYGSRGLVVIGFKATMMRDTEDPARFAQRIGVRYPLAVASPVIVQKFGDLQGLPTTFIYDRRGILRQKIIGFEYTHTIESEIKPLLEPQ